MKTKIAVLMVMTGLLSVFSPVKTTAQRAGGMEFRNNFAAREIPGLTQEQKEKIEAIRLSHAREALHFNNSISEKNAALRTITQQDVPDLEKANQLLEEIYALRLELAKSRLQSQLGIRDELNEEQKLVFDMRSSTLSRLSDSRITNRPFYRTNPSRSPVERVPQRRGMERPGPGSN
jgi:Spy/CpxP family protein refolding chaperone